MYLLRNVRKAYGDRVVLDIDHLRIEAGKIFAVVGPSGAGKSTLLRLLNFLERPTAGTLQFDGQIINGNRLPLTLRRQVTTVFQRPVLLNMSVERNVAYGLQLRAERGDGTVPELLELVGLSKLAKTPARQLSGGEAQRVALARALAIEPRVLLLDEPTANLDPYNVGLIEDIVADVNRRQSTTVVLVTHNVFQARRLAHRAALLLEGRIVEIAEADEFFKLPSDPRTAAFVRGEMVY